MRCLIGRDLERHLAAT